MYSDLVVTVRGARRRHGRVEAVRGVDLDVRRGDVTALLGVDGAGKSSLVEMVAGLAPGDGGVIRVLGHDPCRARRRIVGRLGILLQDGGFSAALTAAETLRLWAGTLARTRPVGEVLELLSLDGRADVRVGDLTGPERRRLDLALAILGRPELLILDEPTTGLDAESRRTVRHVIRGLVDDGVTVLLATHDPREAAELADRIAVLCEGRVVREGAATEVLAAEPARIVFVPHDGAGNSLLLTPADLPRFDGVDRCAVAGGRVRLETADLQGTLEAVLVWARGSGLFLEELDARPASREQVLCPPTANAGREQDVLT